MVPDRAPAQRYRGQSLGLPPAGPGSLAPTGRRIMAFVLDLLAAGLVASPFVHRQDLPGLAAHLPGQWSLIPLALDYLIGLLLFGRSLGMYLTGLRVIRVDARLAIGPIRALVRTALLVALLPALVADQDFRGLHDRLTATAVI
ncbi:RDD family protein, partial [Jatrophihabitans sp.]|uniref:RDD family protein n=1 Tax=Jatrophihabitans sp. TaxID=1932789 RepID=UPI002EE269F2